MNKPIFDSGEILWMKSEERKFDGPKKVRQHEESVKSQHTPAMLYISSTINTNNKKDQQDNNEQVRIQCSPVKMYLSATCEFQASKWITR